MVVVTECIGMAKRVGECLPRGHGGRPLSDEEFRNEQALIGAVLLLGVKDKRVQGWLKKVTGWHFGEPAHSWLWSQLRQGPLTANACAECRVKFRTPLMRIVDQCLEAGFWWWGDWYVEQVLEASVRRGVGSFKGG